MASWAACSWLRGLRGTSLAMMETSCQRRIDCSKIWAAVGSFRGWRKANHDQLRAIARIFLGRRLCNEEIVDPPHIVEQREAEEEEEPDEAADAPVCIFGRVVHEFTMLSKAAHPEVPWASHKTLVKYLGSVAEASLRAQDVNLQNLLKYIDALQGAGALTGVLLLAHVSFDETPLKLSVSFDHNRSVEISRIIAVETSWSMLVHDRQHVPSDAAAAYTLYTGHCSAQLKASDRETG
eukprot:6492225-Amphidinium_carterae.1